MHSLQIQIRKKLQQINYLWFFYNYDIFFHTFILIRIVTLPDLNVTYQWCVYIATNKMVDFP